jgi:hypothetical protein
MNQTSIAMPMLIGNIVSDICVAPSVAPRVRFGE